MRLIGKRKGRETKENVRQEGLKTVIPNHVLTLPLSYKTEGRKEREGKEKGGKKHTQESYRGEMKGRGNEKKKKKIH